MKIQFKTITLVVIFMIAGIFSYQTYLLIGLYRNLNHDLDRRIFEAMGVADQNELFIRLEWVKNQDIGNEISVSAGIDEDSVDNAVYSANFLQSEVAINYNGDETEFNIFKESARTMEKLAAFLQKAMHEAVDHSKTIDIEMYDSLLSVELNRLHIERPYQIVRIQTSNDSVLASPLNQDITKLAGARQFDYYYDIGGVNAYRLLIQNPDRHLLGQMGGLLTTSFVIFALLVFIFIFLLHTIRKLQTEEELKTNFTNNMTHELKTPIAVSYAAVDALLVARKPASQERLERYLLIAREQMNHLSGMVEQLLTMSRKDQKRIILHQEVVHLDGLVDELTEKQRLLSDKPITIQLQLEEETVFADKLHLSNMLVNLIENGIKYSGPHVYLKIASKRDGKLVQISVQDNGIGIDVRHHKKIFDKFFRVPTGNRHNVKGFGLGLFYVKQMTELHGGSVDVTSIPGKGSVFTIKIPKQWTS